jgi:hypothetical protein
MNLVLLLARGSGIRKFFSGSGELQRTNEMHGRQQVAFLSYRYVPQIFVFFSKT